MSECSTWKVATVAMLIMLVISISGCIMSNKPEKHEPVQTPPSLPPEAQGTVEKHPPEKGKVNIILTGSSYKKAMGGGKGAFRTGQDADIVLGWFGFNNSGGSLFFNHPMGIASDGKHLLLADTRNNRILIWNHLPTSNEPPDIVLGQKDFYSCEPGMAKDKLRWPVDVATDGKRVIVADTYNNRVLIWNDFPTENGEPADIVLGQDDFTTWKTDISRITWPWSVWTDGEKLIVTSTRGASVLIWNKFPTRNNQPPDVILTNKDFGTPRNIESDGETYLIIGDHNAKGTGRGGNFVWLSFPKSGNEDYDIYLGGEVLWSSEVIGDDFYGIENHRPVFVRNFRSLRGGLDLMELERQGIVRAFKTITLENGDGSDAVYVNDGKQEITYISLYNGGRVVGYLGKPEDRKPDFTIGSKDVLVNPFTDVHYFVDGGKPVSDGKSLVVLAGYNRRIEVWKDIPDESGALPDIIYELNFEPISGEFYKGKFYVIGRGGDGGGGLAIWSNITGGKQPDVIINREFAGIDLIEARDITFDDKYAYLLANGKMYIFKQPFSLDSRPIKEMEFDPYCPLTSIQSNGENLAAVSACSEVIIFDVDTILSQKPNFVRLSGFNLPEDAFIDKDRLFVADTCFNRVLIWDKIPERGDKKPDVVLGQDSFDRDLPPKYTRDGLFWPGGVWFDGNYLWVVEYKFSNRILRFSPQGTGEKETASEKAG